MESGSGAAESMSALRRRIASSARRRASRPRVVLKSRCGKGFVPAALAELVLSAAGAAAGAELGEGGAGVAVEFGRSVPEDPFVPRRWAAAFARASSFSPSCQKNVAARKQSKLMMTQVRVLNCIRQLSTKQPFSEGRNPSAGPRTLRVRSACPASGLVSVSKPFSRRPAANRDGSRSALKRWPDAPGLPTRPCVTTGGMRTGRNPVMPTRPSGVPYSFGRMLKFSTTA